MTFVTNSGMATDGKEKQRINSYDVPQNLGAGARCYVLKLLLYEHPKLPKLGHGFYSSASRFIPCESPIRQSLPLKCQPLTRDRTRIIRGYIYIQILIEDSSS